MKEFFIVSLLLLFATSVSAQTTDKTIEKIRGYYTEISAKANAAESNIDENEAGQIGPLVVNELVINKQSHQWRAVGHYLQRFKFFYRGGESQEHMYPDQLVKVVVEREISNRSYKQEFLYSETGELIFYFQKALGDDQVPSERRVYFSGAKPIRVIEDGKTRDRMTTTDVGTVKDVVKESGKIKEIFLKSIKL